MTHFDQPEDIVPVAPRTSVLAVTSLVLQVLCCIPGVAAIGALIGVAAVIGISRSDGRVRGMGFAVTGVVLGLLATLAWIVSLTFVATLLRNIGGYSEAIVAIEARDRQTVDVWVSNSNLTDEAIADFADSLQADHGAFVGAPESIADMFSGYSDLERAGISTNATLSEARFDGAFNPLPVPLEFDSGPVLFIVEPEAGGPTAPNSMPTAQNIAYVAPDGTLIWLVDFP